MPDLSPPLPAVAEPTGGPESRNIGWDAAGEWTWAVVIPMSRSQRQRWPTYLPLARFQTKADADAYVALLAAKQSDDPAQAVAEAARIERETGVNPLAMGCAGDD